MFVFFVARLIDKSSAERYLVGRPERQPESRLPFAQIVCLHNITGLTSRPFRNWKIYPRPCHYLFQLGERCAQRQLLWLAAITSNTCCLLNNIDLSFTSASHSWSGNESVSSLHIKNASKHF